MKYKRRYMNTTPSYRHKPKSVVQSANMILDCDSSILADKTVDCNIPDIVHIDRMKQHL
jgi:hypothetical protein